MMASRWTSRIFVNQSFHPRLSPEKTSTAKIVLLPSCLRTSCGFLQTHKMISVSSPSGIRTFLVQQGCRRSRLVVIVCNSQLQDNAGSSSEDDDAEEDVDVALKKEVAQLQASGVKQERRFQALDSGANNVIFIRTLNLESDKLVHHILSDLHATKKKKSRVILRMLPVTGTCKAFQEDIVKYLTTFLEPWFKMPNCATYQIAFKARNSSHNKREEIIKSVAGLVGKLNPKNKVDLTNPELTIIVEVIKAVCCFSVVKDYTLYRKYNVQEVVKEDVPQAKTEAVTDEQKQKDNAGNDEERKEEKGDDKHTAYDKKEAESSEGIGD